MSLASFRKITDSLVGVTEYIYLHLMGEPLTHPDVYEMIAYASSRGFKCAITTNGLLLPDEAERLIASGIYKVSISLHSFEDNDNDAHRRYLDGCFDFADKASRAGILCVMRLWNRGHDGGKNGECLSLLEKRFGGNFLESARGVRIRDKLHLEYGDRFEWPSMTAQDLGDEVFCYGLKDHFGILCDGTVVPCCLDSDGTIALGNALDEPIEAILTSPRAVAMREAFKCRRASEQLCRRCGYARRFSK